MKPSEAGTTSHKLTFVRNSKVNTFGEVEAKKIVKSRNPMSYSKKELIKIGMGSFYKNRAYSARVSEVKFPIVKRTVHYLRDGQLDYYSEMCQRRASAEFLTLPNWLTLLEANAYNETVVKHLNSIQARKVSLLEETKMFRETIKTISSSAIRMVEYAKRMFADPKKWLKAALRKEQMLDHRGRPVAGRGVGYRTIKSFGDLWLEGRYHWIPTYLTMKQAFIELQDMHPGMEVFTKGPIFSAFYSIDEPPLTGYFPDGVHWDCLCETTFKMGCRITAQSEGVMLAKRYGVSSFVDVATFKWETSPWTLLFDWVIPVSNVLLSHSALKGLNVHNAWQTVKRFKTGRVPFINPAVNTSNTFYRVIQNGEIDIEEYERTITPVSALSPNLFIADEIINPRRIVDALSFLTGSRFGKRVISGKI